VFLVVITVTVGLVIFFGAWAVSASEDGRELNFGFAGTTLDDSSVKTSEGGQQAQAAFGAVPIGESPEGASDSWWGQGFLKACPLH
jgi:hypothetical protein